MIHEATSAFWWTWRLTQRASLLWLTAKAEGGFRNWTLVALSQGSPDALKDLRGIAVDASNCLYVADAGTRRIQKRDPTGQWSIVTADTNAVGKVEYPGSLSTDAVGTLYVVDYSNNRSRLLKRDVAPVPW